MANFLILLLQIFGISVFTLSALRIGEKALNAWLCLLAVAMNLFVTKQITLLGLEVTASDAMAVCYLLGLCLIQEYWGRWAARIHVVIAMLVCLGFIMLSHVHLLYTPNRFDVMEPHFIALLNPLPRLVLASLASFLAIQIVDIAFFQYLRSKWQGKWFTGRTGLCLVLSQVLDTILFSFLGLYGLVGNLMHVMIVSFIIKVTVIFFALPFVTFSKKMIPPQQKAQQMRWANNTTE